MPLHQGLKNGFFMTRRKPFEQLLVGPFFGDISDHFSNMSKDQIQLTGCHGIKTVASC
jgi:hypothetical protein